MGMPRLQAVVRPLAGRNKQKLLTPQVKHKTIALLWDNVCDSCHTTRQRTEHKPRQLQGRTTACKRGITACFFGKYSALIQ